MQAKAKLHVVSSTALKSRLLLVPVPSKRSSSVPAVVANSVEQAFSRP